MINLVIPTLILSTIALITSLIAIVLVLAQRWSTHKIEWKPLEFKAMEEEEDTQDPIDNEDTLLKEVLSMQRKGKKRSEDPLDEILETNNF